MKTLTILCILTITASRNVSSVLVDYYPSQSMLSNLVEKSSYKSNNNNQEVNNISNSGKKIKAKWRHFAHIGKMFNDDQYSIKDDHKNETRRTLGKRATDTVFRGHPKTREELWNEHFFHESPGSDQTSLITLIHNITVTYLRDCTPVIIYDYEQKNQDNNLLQELFKDFPVSYVHGYIKENYRLAEPDLQKSTTNCIHYIVFISEVKKIAHVLGKQSSSKVVVIARSSQWAVQEFLSAPESRSFINLLVIGQSFKEDEESSIESPYILYTHELYVDGLGGSMPVVLNSWVHGKFSRNVNLFPPKMTKGYAGHRFVVAAADQPPFVIKRIKTDADGGNPRVTWDGIEIRLLKSLAQRNNFSIEIQEPRELHLGSGNAVGKEIALGKADIGVAGLYITGDRAREMDLTFAHSQDCAVFITLMSTALPRYRAILGPFHWHVWLALTLTYLLGIIPLAFSDKHTLRHLLDDAGEIENMFWYVFGTFTNCFTFVGKNSWSKTTKLTTRILIGWYWIFTIIITSCYTGSIIAFVTLPVFPETVDTIDQLLKGFYRVGTLDRGGWERWFFNSSDPKTNKLLKRLELVPSVEAGIKNTTKAFFWPHAFLGSRAELEYIVQANFSVTKSKRAMLHISDECFVPFGVTLAFPNNSLYTNKLSSDIMRMAQSGLIDKIVDETRWEIQRSPTGGYLAAQSGPMIKISSATEKGLTLEDTQGMFLLLAAGFLLATTALLSEWMGGFTKKCRQLRNKIRAPSALSRENLITTPKSELDNELKFVDDNTDSRLDFQTRSSSAESRDTLEGQIINVTEENIIVHNNLNMDKWNDSRRSSSFDVDEEVRKIFERDNTCNAKNIVPAEEVIDLEDTKRDETISYGAFGDHVK